MNEWEHAVYRVDSWLNIYRIQKSLKENENTNLRRISFVCVALKLPNLWTPRIILSMNEYQNISSHRVQSNSWRFMMKFVEFSIHSRQIFKFSRYPPGGTRAWPTNFTVLVPRKIEGPRKFHFHLRPFLAFRWNRIRT